MVIIRRNPESILAKDAELFAERKRAALLEINIAVGKIRTKFITDIPGQETMYQLKEKEAQRYVLESPEPLDLTNYPLIAGEVGVTAPTAYQLAQVWLNMAYMLTYVGGQLEKIRITCNAAIDSATSDAGIQVVIVQFKTALQESGLV